MGQESEGGGRRRGPRIAICGSTGLERYPESLVDFIADQPTNATILLRAPREAKPGLFEQVMSKLAQAFWISVLWFRPDPDTGPGATYRRDLDLVREADVVLAYFKTTEMDGGTMHVVEKAIDIDRPVYSYGYTGKGFTRIGEHDPFGAWTRSVPS